MKKITRAPISAFLSKYARPGNTLCIGATSGAHAKDFPGSISVDVDPARKPDIVADAHSLPFEDETFDTIVCSEVLEHVADPYQVVSEIYRVLAPGGMVVLTTRFLFPVHDAPEDNWRFTHHGLLQLFSNFTVIGQESDGGIFTAIATVLQRIILQADVRGGRVTKSILHALVLLLPHLDWLVKKSYGSILRNGEIPSLGSAGVFIAAQKDFKS